MGAAWMRHWLRRALPALWLLALSPVAKAAPWPQEDGKGVLIFQATPYRAPTRGYDPTGRVTSNGSFSRLELAAPFWEHGLAPRWTIGLQPRLQAAWLDERSRASSNIGIADVGGFVRYLAYRGRLDVAAVQLLVATPGLDRRIPNPGIAEPAWGTELRALYGIGFALRGQTTGFASIEAAFRGRPGTAADELRVDAAIGFRPMSQLLLMLQSYNNIGLRNNRPGGADYSVAKLQVSATWEFNQSWALSGGYLRDVAGRRLALGQGVIMALWYRY
jgi:hypothetical protein